MIRRNSAKEQRGGFNLSKLEEEVSLRPHDACWAKWYEDEIISLREGFGASACFEHVGSSAIENLNSKPIVDIMVGVDKAALSDEMGSEIRRLGYEYFGRLHPEQDRLFARKRGERSFNLQIVPYQSPQWHEKIAFRDYLRVHPEAVLEYDAVKRQAVQEGNVTLLSYHNFKDGTVTAILKKAMEWYKHKGLGDQGSRFICP